MSVSNTRVNRWPDPILCLSMVSLTVILDLASKRAMVELLEGRARPISPFP